ncbi:hypothetical protein ACRALDRAFT_2107815, partial [Sodiomyces alcalophilus JCM 7366]|uniref:uncharacterized protein n=1 Tax=Sodiomyces alcalophilus JCM 7366 TaxID=591952 RepID=UPI0039B6A100
YININVLIKTKAFFLKATRLSDSSIERYLSFKAFLKAWNSLIVSLIEDLFVTRL